MDNSIESLTSQPDEACGVGEWMYVGTIPPDAVGFVYKIIHLPTNKYYIGKKSLSQKRTLPPLKGYKRKRIVISESNWQNYWRV